VTVDKEMGEGTNLIGMLIKCVHTLVGGAVPHLDCLVTRSIFKKV